MTNLGVKNSKQFSYARIHEYKGFQTPGEVYCKRSQHPEFQSLTSPQAEPIKKYVGLISALEFERILVFTTVITVYLYDIPVPHKPSYFPPTALARFLLGGHWPPSEDHWRNASADIPAADEKQRAPQVLPAEAEAAAFNKEGDFPKNPGVTG